MTDEHITETVLEAYKRGDISSEILLRRTLRHLQQKCETCYKEIFRWRRTRVSTSLRHLLQVITEEEFPTEDERERADADLKTLIPLEVSERVRKVRRALSRFRSPLLARSLIQEAVGELAHDPDEASNLVELAFAILEHGQTSGFRREVRAYGLAVKAMLMKLEGELGGAVRLFEEARRVAPRHGIVDLVLAGEIDYLEGALLKDRRELARAEELLKKSLTSFCIVGDIVRQARSYLVLSAVRFHSNRFDEAVADSKRVLELVPEHKAYRAFATHNISLFLAESGRSEEAARRLKKYQSRYEEAKGVWRTYDLHFHWLAGKIAYGLGRYDQSEVHLTKARDGLLERGTTYDAILTCLDLALVYDATGRHEDLMELTRMISGELARKSLHKESVVAITLFLKAVAKQRVSDELVREIGRFLEFSRTDPTLKCDISLRQFE